LGLPIRSEVVIRRAATQSSPPTGRGKAAMAASAQDRIRELTQPMLQRKLYVVISTPIGAPDAIMACTPSHLEYMIGLEKQGLVFASGPFLAATGKPTGHGMTILRTASAEEARRIAEADPFYVKGLRTFEIREWMLMEGSFGLTVKFSDQSVEVA
jgi:uncharacterized protein YciI